MYQVQVQLLVPGHVVQTTIQVHKEPLVDLLLGSDLQPALGFLFKLERMLMLPMTGWTVVKRKSN